MTAPDFSWIINQMIHGHLFPDATDDQVASLREMGLRWQTYVKEKKWIYEQHRSSFSLSLSCPSERA